MYAEGNKIEVKANPLSSTDHWILERLDHTIEQVTLNLDRYEFGIAGNELSDFVWNDLCSNYIEFAKSGLQDETTRDATLSNLIYVLDATMRLLHPFLPFVTEEIYQEIHGKDTSITVASWPEVYGAIDKKKADEAKTLIAIIKLVRELRSENDIKPNKDLHVSLTVNFALDRSKEDLLYKMCHIIAVDKLDGKTLVRPIGEEKIEFMMDEIVDVNEEIAKIEKELETLRSELARSKGILSNANFLAKAPQAKVDLEKEKLEHYQASYDTLAKKLKELKGEVDV